MFVVCVDFEIRQADLAEFMPRMMRQAKNSLELEPGCLRFDVCADPKSPTSIFLYELYESEEAFKLHLATPHFLSFDKAIADWVASKTIRTFGLCQF